jgi:hypothetical protein
MKIRSPFFVTVLAVWFAACNRHAENVESKNGNLEADNRELKAELASKDSILSSKEAALNEFLKAFNEIQDNLNRIKAKEKLLVKNTKSEDIKQNDKESIIADIKFIYWQMNQNKQRLATFSKQLKDSRMQTEALEHATDNLNSLLLEKQDDIEALRSELTSASNDFEIIKYLYVEESQELDAKTQALSTAYYAVGTTKELESKGILTRQGGFMGFGKTDRLNNNAEDAGFQRINIPEVKEIPLYAAKKARLVTPHPDGSYRLEEGKVFMKLVILDPFLFWKNSKYLVVTIQR